LAYSVVYKQSVARDLKRLSKAEGRRLLERIERELPRKATNLPVLKGKFRGLRKYRCGPYRIIFAIRSDDLIVLRVGHRKDVYREEI